MLNVVCYKLKCVISFYMCLSLGMLTSSPNLNRWFWKWFPFLLNAPMLAYLGTWAPSSRLFYPRSYDFVTTIACSLKCEMTDDVHEPTTYTTDGTLAMALNNCCGFVWKYSFAFNRFSRLDCIFLFEFTKFPSNWDFGRMLSIRSIQAYFLDSTRDLA